MQRKNLKLGDDFQDVTLVSQKGTGKCISSHGSGSICISLALRSFSQY